MWKIEIIEGEGQGWQIPNSWKDDGKGEREGEEKEQFKYLIK